MQIFGIIAGSLVSSVLVGLFLRFVYLMIRANHLNSREEVQKVNQVFELPKSSIWAEQSWKLTGTPPETELVNAIAETLRMAGGQIVRHDYDQLVVFWGSRQEARINGLDKQDLLATPTRLILKTRDMHGQIWLQTRLDQDFGFSLDFGPLKQKMIKRYEDTFKRITELLMPAFDAYEPKRIRIIAGTTGGTVAAVV